MSGPVATPACREFKGYRRARVCLPTISGCRGALTASIAARLLSVLPLICIIALLAGCGTTALKPEEKLVSSVTSLPPVQVPVPVRCVKEIPPEPTQTICVPVQANDPNCDVRRRYFEMKAALAELDGYKIRARAALLGCIVDDPAK